MLAGVTRLPMTISRTLAGAVLLALPVLATACQLSGQGGAGSSSGAPSSDSGQIAAPVVRQSTPGGASQAP